MPAQQRHVILLSIPGLRRRDLDHLPALTTLFAKGTCAQLQHSFPAVTWPAQATLLTGSLPQTHGVVANGFYWRDEQRVEMWTAGNEVIEQPQIWDVLKQRAPALTSAAWFPMLSKRCGADFVCMPAPVHNPDGSESLWCYTKPTEYYGDLLEELGHFPLQNFWGPLANIESSRWILQSAARAWCQHQPNFSYIYVPHLDYAAQRDGPNSAAATQALTELDTQLAEFCAAIQGHQSNQETDWMVVSEYVIGEVDHYVCPNRILREHGLLQVSDQEDGEHLDLSHSRCWALVDHQFSHVFVKQPDDVPQVVELFQDVDGIESVVSGQQRGEFGMDHPRSGEVLLISSPHSWQAYYWWLDDARAPAFARQVDIHRKPGYDPVELFWDREQNGVPLDPALVKGSHGCHAVQQEAILLASEGIGVQQDVIRDVDVAELVLGLF